MIIVISPAKIMKEARIHETKSLPCFMSSTNEIYDEIKQYDFIQLKSLMNINEKIAQTTYDRYQMMKFDRDGYCALDAYDGLQFKSMKLEDISEKSWEYLDTHLRIVSGFYGMLKPSDSIYPYRLEMQTPLSVDGCGQLYSFWMDRIANGIKEERKHHKEAYVINLASKEYDRILRPYFLDNTFIDIIFLECRNGTYKTFSTQAKKARGEMVRWMADHACEYLEDIKKFQVDGYRYDINRSTDESLVFVKDK